MLINYLKIAVRHILHQKFYSFINIIGLAVGIACCVLITLYVINETNYDNFHSRANRIVRATMEFNNNGVVKKVPVTGTKVVPAFKHLFPEVEDGVRIFKPGAVVKYKDKVFNESGFVYADSSFFNIFSFHLLYGDKRFALSNPNSIVLTLSAAKKYFGHTRVIGESLIINNKEEYIITGIIQDVPVNSQIKFDFLASFSSLSISRPENEKWAEASYFSYFLLKNSASINAFQQKIHKYMKAHNDEIHFAGSDYLMINIEPLKDVHLFSQVEGGLERSGDYRYVYVFSLIAILILVIACANYINITTARGSERAKEIGIRKVTGAYRTQLFNQFMGESFITVIIAFIIALFFVELLFPIFNSLTGIKFSHAALLQPNVLIITGLIILLVTIFGGIYPVLLISGFNPIEVLKGNLKTNSSGFRLRKSLIVIQFIISISLIICALVIWSQLNYIQNKKLGFNRDCIIALPVDEYIKNKAGVFKSELLSNSNISNVTFATRTPVIINSTSVINYNNKKIMINQIGVDEEFIGTVGVKIIEGTNFTSTDTIKNSANIYAPIMLNETAIKQMNLIPQEAVGQIVEFQHNKCIVKAVVKDFHFSTMREQINPLILFRNSYPKEMLLKISGNNISHTLGYIQKKWGILAPHFPFEYQFLDDQFADLYKTEARTGKIFYVFSSIAILLACLGLFGLIALSTQQRTKEIGIRKVLGADSIKIVVLLIKDFLKLIIISNILAFPIAYKFISGWLENFAYRINISWWIFALAGGIALIIALAAISFQAIKAAMANPVDSLKYE